MRRLRISVANTGRRDAPKADCLVAHIDPMHVQRIIDTAERKRKADVQRQREADDFGGGSENFEGGGLGRSKNPCNRPALLK